MGEVWRAVDTRLNREIAIKFCNAEFATRFQREAATIASLNHPNICTLFDVGPDHLVMEYVDGAEPKGPLPLERVLEIAGQIAAALEAAHEKGIVHRDLKPGNIKLRADGSVKVLDFGLAKSPGQQAVTPDSPTLLSVTGMILGTAGYMSPEQARGQEVDKRADIFAFGVVVYELLTGERLFNGATVSDTIAAVLMREPDLAKVPMKVRRLLRKCLEKDPRKRLRDIADWAELLDADAPIVTATTPPPPRTRIAWISAAGFAIVAAILGFLHFREKTPEPHVTNTAILPPPGHNFDFRQGTGLFAISPDGRKLVFGARSDDGKSSLWLRLLDSATAQPLAGTENASFPFWSPDSRYVAFFADGKLRKIDTLGGPAITITDAPLGRGGTWSRDGVILFAPENVARPLMRVSAAGGAAVPVSAELGSTPWFLPDGKHFLFQDQASLANGEQPPIRVGSLDGSKSKQVAIASTNAVYADGYLLYLLENVLMAQPFDTRSLVTTGEAFPLAEQVERVLNSGRVAAISVSQSGHLLYRQGADSRGIFLRWFDRDGTPGPRVGEAATQTNQRISPDEHHVVESIQAGATVDLWIIDLLRGLRTRFTVGNRSLSPVWSPDGRRIAFARKQGNSTSQYDLYAKAADASGTETLLYADNNSKVPTSWSSDGRWLLYETLNGIIPGGRIFALPLESTGSAKPVALTTTRFTETNGRFSPDGNWLAYQSIESGQSEVYVAPFPPDSRGEGKQRISETGGSLPEWSSDGKELFYRAFDGYLMAAEVKMTPNSFQTGKVARLFRSSTTGSYGVVANGKRFLLPEAAGESSSIPLTLVANWSAKLKTLDGK
jgi:serine/threonine protein kinase